MSNLIAKLYQTKKTILTTKDIALLWQNTDRNNLKSKIAYYVKKGVLVRLTRGVFAKDKNYNLEELATSIYAPSYISFETVLQKSGITFQHYETMFLAGQWSKAIKIDGHSIIFRKLKDSVLFNPVGILNRDDYSIATPERAFLDTIYLFPQYYFDNLRSVNWEKCFELVNIYDNRQMQRRLNKYYKNHAE